MQHFPIPNITFRKKGDKLGKLSAITRAWSSWMVSGGLVDDLLLPRSRLWRLSRPTAHIFPTKRVGVGAWAVVIVIMLMMFVLDIYLYTQAASARDPCPRSASADFCPHRLSRPAATATTVEPPPRASQGPVIREKFSSRRCLSY